MTDRTQNVILRYQVDKSTADEGIRTLREIQTASDAAKESLLAIGGDVAKTSAEFERLDAISKTISRDLNIDEAARQFYEMGKAVGDTETALIRLRAALREVGASGDEIRRATTEFQRLKAAEDEAADGGGKASKGIGGEGLRRTGGALSQLGGLVGAQDLGRPLQIAGDIVQVNKELNELSGVLTGVGPAAAAATTATTAASGGFGALVASVSPLLLVLAPVAAALLALKLILDQIKSASDAAVAAQQKEFAQEQADLQRKRENREAGKSRSSEQNKDFVDTNFTNAQDYTDAIAAKKAEIDKNNSDYAALGNSLNPGERSRLGAVGQELQKELDSLVKAQGELFDASKNAAENVQPLIDKREEEQRATQALLSSAEDLATGRKNEAQLTQMSSEAAHQRVAELKAEQQGLQSAIDALKTSGNTSKEVTDKIAEYTKQMDADKAAQQQLTDTILPLINAREAEIQATNRAREAFTQYAAAAEKARQLGEEITRMENDRQKVLDRRKEQDDINSQRAGIEADYKQRIDAAKRDEAKDAITQKLGEDNAKAEIKLEQDKQEATQKFFDAELKAYQDYFEAEQRATDRNNLERMHILESAQADLKNLAARGDVAGFVERSNQAKLQLKAQAENASAEAKQRHDDFEKAITEAATARDRDFQNLESAFEREKQARQDQADQRLREIEMNGQIANSRASQLEQELNGIREQWRIDDMNRQRTQEEQDYNERLALQQEKQNEALQSAQDFYEQWVQYAGLAQQATIVQPTDNYYGSTRLTSGGQQRAQMFATGLEYVPHDDFKAVLHEGERIMTARENVDYTYGSRGDQAGATYQVIQNNTVGDVATVRLLEETQHNILQATIAAFQQSQGVGIHG